MKKFFRRLRRREAGMATAEFAILTIASVAIALVMVAIVRSAPVHNALNKVVVSALDQAK
jgi:Flp pilus assembly pilin Flp